MVGRRSATVLAIAMALLAAGPARAAFPGRNGLLALDPPGGTGIVLATAAGHVVRTVCPGPAIASPDIVGASCHGIAGASWSPDGRVLLLRQNGDVSLIYADGSCLACREGAGTPITGAAFTRRDELLLTEAPARRRGVFTASAYDGVIGSGFEAMRLHLPTFAAPADPAAGTLPETVFVARRHGRSWIARPPIALPGKRGSPRHFGDRWLLRGTAPAFSPDGRRLAFARGGWIWLRTTHTGRLHRLLRGRSAAFSPDGLMLAVIGRGDTVSITTLATGRTRVLEGLRATHVDWQPLVSAPPACMLPAGSSIAASGPGVVIYTDGASRLACLGSSHETRLLATSFFHNQIGISGYQFAGSTLAYVWSQTPEEFSTCFPELEYLIEVNLTGATTRMSDQVQNGCHPGDGSLQLDSWLLAPSGAVASIVSSETDDATTGTASYGQALIVHDSAGNRRIDTASETTSGIPSPILANLAVTGTTLTWDHAGQPRTAQLGGAP